MESDNEASGNGMGITRCGDRLFHWGNRTYIMGIINLSPDSFSGDGCQSINDAIYQAHQFVQEGADIIDVGGESTRPNAEVISVDEEVRRVIPFIKEVTKSINIPISIDTYKYEVARQALDAGANMINDISGLKMRPCLAALAAERDVPVILTSNERGRAHCHIIDVIKSHLKDLIELALQSGVNWQNLIVDPGIGFGKTHGQNLEILRRLDELKPLKRPILIGTSRKSFIGNVLGSEIEERIQGTAASIAIGICNGADMVRVHDVRKMSLVCRMSDAIVRGYTSP